MPVIVISSSAELELTISLAFHMPLESVVAYPKFNVSEHSWAVKYCPEGWLLLNNDPKLRKFQNLFYEVELDVPITIDHQKSICIQGHECRHFLLECLVGFLMKEQNDFLTYWLPQMEHLPYVQIQILNQDSMLGSPLIELNANPLCRVRRLFMIWRSLIAPIENICTVKETLLAISSAAQ